MLHFESWWPCIYCCCRLEGLYRTMLQRNWKWLLWTHAELLHSRRYPVFFSAHILTSLRPLQHCYLSFSSLDLCDATRRCWLLYTVIIQFMSEAQRSPVCCSRFQAPWIIKMPLAMHYSCKLFLVLHLAPTSHFGRARPDQLRKKKVQIRCFLRKHLFPLSPLLLLLPFIFFPNQHALLKQSQTRSCKRGNKLRKFISQGCCFHKLNINFFFLFFSLPSATRMRHVCPGVVCSGFIRLG